MHCFLESSLYINISSVLLIFILLFLLTMSIWYTRQIIMCWVSGHFPPPQNVFVVVLAVKPLPDIMLWFEHDLFLEVHMLEGWYLGFWYRGGVTFKKWGLIGGPWGSKFMNGFFLIKLLGSHETKLISTGVSFY